MPDPGVSSCEWRSWENQLQQIWLDEFGLGLEAIQLSQEESGALENYLDATELIIRCKQSAVRVSRTAWEALERRLLTWEEQEGKT